MVVINQITPAYVSFSVPARILPQVRAGQRGAGLKVSSSVTTDGARHGRRVS